MQSHKTQAGITLVEACCALAITGILISTAAPSYRGTLERRVLEGVAAELGTDLHLARHEAVARGEPVRVSFHTDAGGSCYLLHTGGASDCTCDSSGAGSCAAPARELKTVGRPTTGAVQVEANVPSLMFDPVRGVAKQFGSVSVVGASGQAITHKVSVVGRVRTCTPGGSVPGYLAC